jgi:hypothetical protein
MNPLTDARLHQIWAKAQGNPLFKSDVEDLIQEVRHQRANLRQIEVLVLGLEARP